jgi:thiol:disulfide interchange protein DsbD
VLLDTAGNLLTTPRAYNLDIDAFVEFLNTGVDNFNKQP